MANEQDQVVGDEWVTFPGGELEGKRPKTLCAACRDALKREAAARLSPSHLSHASHPSHLSHYSKRPLCFQCYRVDLDRRRALRAAGELNTASDARFQVQLPFEPVDRLRLEMLKAERSEARGRATAGVAQHVDKRCQAQIAARHALQAVAARLKAGRLAIADRHHAMASAIHAAELQLPASWLPFVVSR